MRSQRLSLSLLTSSSLSNESLRLSFRLLIGRYRWEHFIRGAKEPLMDYVKRRVIEDYGTEDLSRATEIYYQDLMSRLVTYDKSKY